MGWQEREMRHRGFIGWVCIYVCVWQTECVLARFSMLTSCRPDLNVISWVCGLYVCMCVCVWIYIWNGEHVFGSCQHMACVESPGALVPTLAYLLKAEGSHDISPLGMWPLDKWNSRLRLDWLGWPSLIPTRRRMPGVDNVETQTTACAETSTGSNRISMKTRKS